MKTQPAYCQNSLVLLQHQYKFQYNCMNQENLHGKKANIFTLTIRNIKNISSIQSNLNNKKHSKCIHKSYLSLHQIFTLNNNNLTTNCSSKIAFYFEHFLLFSQLYTFFSIHMFTYFHFQSISKSHLKVQTCFYLEIIYVYLNSVPN